MSLTLTQILAEIATNFPNNTGGAITPDILRTTIGDIAAATQLYSNDAYIVVQTTDDPVANGTALLATYAAAKALTPNGQAIGEFNRAAVVVPPGVYDLAETGMTLDADYVDVVGLTGNPDHVLITSQITDASGYTVGQGDVWVCLSGISIENTASTRSANDATDACAFSFFAGSSKITLRSCRFLDGSGLSWCMVQAQEFSGSAVDCVAVDFAFGSHGGAFSGDARRCTAGSESFGSDADFNGYAEDCRAGSGFGGGSTGIFWGTAIRCYSDGGESFGGDEIGGGAILTDCTSFGEKSFGGNRVGGATLLRCWANADNCFASGAESEFAGLAQFCKGASNCFGGGDGSFLGVAEDCEGEDYCFGAGPGDGGAFSGRALRCRAIDRSFGSGVDLGSFESVGYAEDCVGRYFCFGGAIFDGRAVRCEAEDASFGQIVCSGVMIDCRMAYGSFGGGAAGNFSGVNIRPILQSEFNGNFSPFGQTWAPSVFTGMITDARFEMTDVDQNAVTVPDGATGTFLRCTFIKTGSGFPLGIASSGTAAIKFSHCLFNAASPIETGITNLLGATLADAFNIGNVDVV